MTGRHGNITREKTPLVSMVDDDDVLNYKDSMPKYFKEMEKHDL
jgi:hypothetical protein